MRKRAVEQAEREHERQDEIAVGDQCQRGEHERLEHVEAPAGCGAAASWSSRAVSAGAISAGRNLAAKKNAAVGATACVRS